MQSAKKMLTPFGGEDGNMKALTSVTTTNNEVRVATNKLQKRSLGRVSPNNGLSSATKYPLDMIHYHQASQLIVLLIWPPAV